ncbi:MAG: GIY-YIG nuclease family protein [candidate division Zixibacteria bacterium]|nr:GIY-YIG nuclease family protein [candidate division Zixibacteria bacterium]
MKQYYTYIMTSKRNGTLYIGVTSNLVRRVYEHKNETVKGFTKKYNIKRLIYYEIYQDAREAIMREKRLKSWKRKWKLDLIEQENPEWLDLYDSLT